jgi:hypothetical protein
MPHVPPSSRSSGGTFLSLIIAGAAPSSPNVLFYDRVAIPWTRDLQKRWARDYDDTVRLDAPGTASGAARTWIARLTG